MHDNNAICIISNLRLVQYIAIERFQLLVALRDYKLETSLLPWYFKKWNRSLHLLMPHLLLIPRQQFLSLTVKSDGVWLILIQSWAAGRMKGANGDIACDQYHKYKVPSPVQFSLCATLRRFIMKNTLHITRNGCLLIEPDIRVLLEIHTFIVKPFLPQICYLVKSFNRVPYLAAHRIFANIDYTSAIIFPLFSPLNLFVSFAQYNIVKYQYMLSIRHFYT